MLLLLLTSLRKNLTGIVRICHPLAPRLGQLKVVKDRSSPFWGADKNIKNK